jgi:hypothetical protein
MAKLHRDNAGYIGCSHEETQDPYYSYNKLSLSLSGAAETVQRPAEVTHTVTVAGGKFVIGGVSQATLSLVEGGTYKFDQSDSSNSNHPFRFSQTSNGTWNRGTEYTKGVSYVGTPGSSGAYTQLVVPFGGLDLYYYCGNHTGMGGSATTPANAGMFTAALPILKTTDQFGATLGSGVNADPFAANLVLAVPMNGSNNGTTFTDQSAAIKGSGSAKAITRTNAVTSTAQSIYYGSSGYFDRTGDYISTTNSSTDFAFGTGSFTVEGWFKYDVKDSYSPGFFQLSNAGGGSGTYAGGIYVAHEANGNRLYVNVGNDTTGYTPTDSYPEIDGVWHHVAVVGDNGSTVRVYIDGIYQPLSGGTSNPYDIDTAAYVTIGKYYSNSNYEFGGYIQDFRVYKGVAKYQPEESGDLGFQALSYYGNGSNVQHIGGNIFSQTSSVVGGTISDAHKAFNGSGADWANLTASSTSTAAHVDFNFQRPIQGITRIEAAFDSPSGSGDTRGRFNGSNAGATRTGTGSGYSDIYNGASITVNSVGFAINQNSTTGTNNDIVSRYRVTDSSGTRFLINGNGSNIPFKPDLVWLKNDDTYTGHHCLYDSVRGVYKHLQTSSVALEYTENTGRGLSSFNSDGFTIDTSTGEHQGEGNINQSGQRYSAYAWKAGGTATTIAAGSLTSSAYDQSQTWSTSGTASGWYSSAPLSRLFNGGLNSYADSTTSTTTSSSAIWTYTISNVTSFKLRLWVPNRTYHVAVGDIKVNGNDIVQDYIITPNLAQDTWHTIDLGNIGTFNSIYIDDSYWYFQAIYINGKMLVDSGVTPPNVPSIASSVSTSSEYGFSIVKYSPASSTETLAHSLGNAPRLILVKRTDQNASWSVFHADAGPGMVAELNGQGKPVASLSAWSNTAPTSDVFSIGNYPDTGVIGADYIAYLFADKTGYQKISSYTGTGASGNVVTTGFRPSFLLIKADIDGEDWIIMDDARTPENPVNDAFFANTLAVPNAISVYSVDFNDDGFTVNNNNPRFNTNTATYYYMAIAGRKPSDPGQDAFKLLDTLNTKDQSSSAHIVTNNGASFQTSVKKFYGGAAEFDGSDSYLSIPASNDLNFGGGDFTMECWFYQRSTAGMSLTDYGTQSSGTAPYGQWYYNAARGLHWYHASGFYAASGAAWNLNSWVHAALVRHGNSMTQYINGSQVSSSAFSRTDAGNSTLNFEIGRQGGGTEWDGFIQDFRIYKGIAKYTSSFSPPERSIQGTARRYPSGVYVVS